MQTATQTPKLDKVERRLANKYNKYWASRRAELQLLRRSSYGDLSNPANAALSETLNSELDLLLVFRTHTYPPLLKELGLEEEMSYKEKREQLGIELSLPDRSKEEQLLIDHMEQLKLNARTTEWRWRVANHAEEYQAKGWYPFFITLTIDPKSHDPERVWKEGKALRNYIRRLCNVVTTELELRPAHKTNTPESEYITYVGCIEHGKSRQHHHGHFLIWMREIPEDWKQCPNHGIQNPGWRNRRECWQLRKYWGDYHGVNELHEPIDWRPYSLPERSPAMYFRSIGDIWSQLGHVHPVDENQKPIRIGTPRQSGGYITKYLSKDHKEWQHRMKATRNLGKKHLIAKIQTLPDRAVKQLTYRPPTSKQNHSVRKIHTVPLGLLRRLSKQEHFFRLYRSNQLDLRTLTQTNSNVFIKMLRNVKTGVRPDRMGSEEFYDWLGQLLPVQDGYCETEFFEAHQRMADQFPRNINKATRIPIPGASHRHS